MVMSAPEKLCIPRDIYGIATGAFSMAKNIREIYIPISVVEIGADVFGVFDDTTEIYCRADEKPQGWADSETQLNTDETGCEMLHNYWLGSAKFTFDSNGILTYLPLTYRKAAPKVVWGYKG